MGAGSGIDQSHSPDLHVNIHVHVHVDITYNNVSTEIHGICLVMVVKLKVYIVSQMLACVLKEY